MYEIKENHKTVYGSSITTYSREVVSANILEVEAGTNGYFGGDAGHGSRTYFRIENAGGTCMDVYPTKDGFELFMGGDCELSTIIDALKFVVLVLEDQAHGDV